MQSIKDHRRRKPLKRIRFFALIFWKMRQNRFDISISFLRFLYIQTRYMDNNDIDVTYHSNQGLHHIKKRTSGKENMLIF